MFSTLTAFRCRSTLLLLVIVAWLAFAVGARVGAGDKPPGRPPLAECVQHADKVPADTSPWGSLRWLMNAKLDANSPLTVGIAELNPGHSNPLHIHPNSDEVIYVLSGTCEQLVGDEKVILRPGDTLRIPAGVPHQAKVLGNEPQKAIVIYNTGNRQFTPVKESPAKAH